MLIAIPIVLIFAKVLNGVLIENVITPSNPTANSQAYLTKFNKSSQFTIHAANISSCRFKTAIIPCECFFQVSNFYRLEENNNVISKFSVGPPKIRLFVPTTHEMLNELLVHIDSQLCRADNSTIRLEHRPFQIFPNGDGVEDSWTPITDTIKELKNQKTSVQFGCKHFADPGYYRLSVRLSLLNYTVQSENWIRVNQSNHNMLRLRQDSIFPHCSSTFQISWKLDECSLNELHYRLRVVAVPEGSKNNEDGAIYIEEISINRDQASIQISCSQFDIIFEKYCFDLVSVNKNTSRSHTWHSVCVNTEPADKKIGGWSPWSEWSACSETCGHGIQRRVRFCNQPVPKRSKYCDGPLIETQECALSKCPEAMMPETLATNCSCGCQLTSAASSFFATARNNHMCSGNQTWSFSKAKSSKIVDLVVRKEGNAEGKLFFFLRSPYHELVWSSDSHQENQFSLPMSTPIFIVLWSKKNVTGHFKHENGFTVSYSIRDIDGSPTVAKIQSCQPFCPETMAIAFMSILFIILIFVPPFICASITASIRRNHSPDLPLMDNKYDSEMIRSGNTETTHVSTRHYVAKRSIGIQLSVQSTPRAVRACTSSDSPLPPCGQSSLSECDELEYDYYDGTTFPGSLLAPVQNFMHSQIDIDQIIGQSELLINNVEKADMQTQI